MDAHFLAHKTSRLLAVAGIWLLIGLGPALANDTTQGNADDAGQNDSQETLHTQVEEAIDLYSKEIQSEAYESVEIDIQPVDPRLRLARCSLPLAIEHRPRSRTYGRLTMRVECNGDEPWAIHVPVTIQAFAKVLVADVPIAKGTQLNANDVRIESRDVSLLYGGFFADEERIKGYVAKRPISVGQVINATLLDPAKMINRGEKVVIVAEGPGLNIRTTGIAVNDGAYGELIRVKNSSTEKVVEGRITGPGRVKVSL